MILIIGNCSAKEQSVIDEIQKYEQKVVVFKADKCLEGETIFFDVINQKARTIAIIDDKEIDLKEITAIWFWKPILPKNLRVCADFHFINSQFTTLWHSLSLLLRDPKRKWVNDYFKILEAEHKPYQLQVASLIGFNLPDTLITSDPQKAIEFYNYCQKEMIIKTLMMTLNENSCCFTNQFTEDLLPKIERLKTAPVILQKLIRAKKQLRITVVGDWIFSAEVISESKLDWRRHSKITMETYNLPQEIMQKCFKLVKLLGLNYGCIDLILNTDNEYIFLEINPNGQWIFVEEKTGMQIGRAIAYLLLS